MNVGTSPLVILKLMLNSVLPAWLRSVRWGYFQSGGVGLLMIVIVLVVTGRIWPAHQNTEIEPSSPPCQNTGGRVAALRPATRSQGTGYNSATGQATDRVAGDVTTRGDFAVFGQRPRKPIAAAIRLSFHEGVQ
jgi:hypothetical protein